MVVPYPFLLFKYKGAMLLDEYLKAQNKTNEIVIAGAFSADELNRFSKSDSRWADNRKKQFQFRTIKKGEIYQFEFGKNYIPEMSYEHRGFVIGVKKKLLYVLPIFSYISAKQPDVFHPIDFPYSQSDLFLLKSQDFSFLTHDSVLKLNDIRTVSINRILYQHIGRIDPNSDTYKWIVSLSLKKYFPEFCYESMQKDAAIAALNEGKEKLEEENKKLKEEILFLRSKLSKSE
ncbi:MAG: type II toxin-antitoxin system PemK/MazF family toxin [Ruminococcus sp.]|nr:type II toxin-antitoxin system PemK/MazF family toxin [Ruminococcus sp.]